RLAADLGEFAFDYADMQLKDLKIGVLLHRVSAILREHSIVLPSDLTLLFKALITLEGLGHQYDPEFRPIDRVKPFVDRAMRERYRPVETARRAQQTLSDLFGLVTSMPRDLARLVPSWTITWLGLWFLTAPAPRGRYSNYKARGPLGS